MHEFDFEVTLSPDNNKKWLEMMEDPKAREVLLKIYQDLTKSALVHSNQSIEHCYASYKEGTLDDHYKYYLALQEQNLLEQLRNML